jgi:hypothetical protein
MEELIQAPRAGSGGRDIKEGEKVKDRLFAAVPHRPRRAQQGRRKVRGRKFDCQDNGGEACEQSEEQQSSSSDSEQAHEVR